MYFLLSLNPLHIRYFSEVYLRLKYGNLADALSVPLMALRLLTAPQAFPGARLEVLKNLIKLGAKAPKALAARKIEVIVLQLGKLDLTSPAGKLIGHGGEKAIVRHDRLGAGIE